jgi:hypothetical protein
MFKRKKEKTQIIVQCDVGFSNNVYLRGEGPKELNWSKGVPLKNVKANEWIWETDGRFQDGQFKVLVNDQVFELGENHKLSPGASIRINPKF